MVRIEFRKIISFGQGSYVVSLPKSWMQKNNLQKGSLVSYYEGADELVLSSNHLEKKKEEKIILIEVEGKDLNRIKSEVISAYMNNYNTIEVFSKNKIANAADIKSLLRGLAGLEILEQTSTKIVSKDLLNIHDISIGNLMRRMDNIIRGMFDDCNSSIHGEDHSESLYNRDIDVNRIFYLVKRVVNNGLGNSSVAKVLGMNNLQLSSERLVSQRLEKIADRLKRISRYTKGFARCDKTVKELDGTFSEIKQSYLDVMKSYYTHDKNLAFSVEANNRNRVDRCFQFLESNTGCIMNGCFIMKEISEGKKSVRLSSCTIDLLRKRIESNEPNTCIQIAKITENLIGMSSSINYLARAVIETE